MYTDSVTPIIHIIQEAINSHQEMRVTSYVDKQFEAIMHQWYIKGHKKENRRKKVNATEEQKH